MVVNLHTETELMDFIIETPLNVPQIKKILSLGYGIFIIGNETKADIIKSLQLYFKTYSGKFEKPLFLD